MAPPPAAALPIDRLVWVACAVPLSRIPAVGSQVFYFPYGHAEQCPTPLPDPLPAHQVFPCTVTDVHLSVDAVTDEPYATISLVPGPHHDQPQPPPSAPSPAPEPDLSYFAKQLTQSDANNGGGFSVPRFCADNIFPGLDFSADPPVQNLRMKDLQGREWEFRHIYRGTPRRHLLTTGWSKFVNAKLLVSGDTVVFMCRSDADADNDKELLVGVRRAARYGGYPPRNARARVPADEVVEAVRLAASGAAFTVTYYPRHGAGEFVVPRKEVEDGVRSEFKPGMQVKMQVMEADDTHRTAWATGIINDVHQTMWRMLEVEWDVSTASSSTLNQYVNCWQVKHAGIPPFLNGLEISENTTSPEGATATVPAPLLVQQVPAMAALLASQLPAAMQGARHNIVPADAPSSSTAMSMSQASLTGNLQISVPHGLSGTSSDIVNPQSGSSSNNIPPSDIPDKIWRIQLFGTTITPHVQSASSSASEQVTQGIDDETVQKDDTSATNTLDSLGIGHNQNGAGQGA
ncbi:hypothetical protein ABZP36_004055 [Zizania latifolia]